MTFSNTKRSRKATTVTPEIVAQRVLSHLTHYLMQHGTGFETSDGDVVIHTAPGELPLRVSVTAHYGDENRAYILVRTSLSKSNGYHKSCTSGERSATQRLFNEAHAIVTDWSLWIQQANA